MPSSPPWARPSASVSRSAPFVRRSSQAVLTLAVKVGQIIAFSVVLGVTWRDRERGNASFLQTYIIGQIVRLAIVLPMSFVYAVMPPRGRADETPEEAEARESRRVFGSPTTDRWIRLVGDLLALFNLAWFLLFVCGSVRPS